MASVKLKTEPSLVGAVTTYLPCRLALPLGVTASTATLVCRVMDIILHERLCRKAPFDLRGNAYVSPGLTKMRTVGFHTSFDTTGLLKPQYSTIDRSIHSWLNVETSSILLS